MSSCKGLPGCVENQPKDDLSLMERAKGFIKTTGKHISNGMKNVDDSVYKERLSVCKKCEHLALKQNMCKKCGCYLPIKAKWEVSECPINKWKK